MPIKPNIGTKTDFAARPSVPVGQKQSATEFNLLVSAVVSNYNRLMLRWSTDIVANTTLEVGQYIVFTDESIYRINTSYNVGNPITWNAANATLIGVGSSTGQFRGSWDGTSDTVPVNADAVGSGSGGSIVAGDTFFLGAGGGNFDPQGLGAEFYPADTTLIAKQNSPTLHSHYLFK